MRASLLIATALVATAPAALAQGLALPAPKPGHAKPLVVVLADNAGSETTDFLIPYGVLKDSGAAEVTSVSTRPGPVRLVMALKVEADETTAQFDAAHPEGADLVIVPAMMKPKNAAVAAFLRAQYAKGSVVMSICSGAQVVAHAGLFENRRATSHWSDLKSLDKKYPHTRWVRDQRYVQDGRVISTTGVSASIPASLALVEAMAGYAAAEAEAQRLGASDWGPRHRTADFVATRADYVHGLSNLLAFWRYERVETPVADGVDEVALALRADAWSRSYKTKVVATAAALAPVRTRHGLKLIPDAAPRPGAFVAPTHEGGAVAQLDATLKDIDRRYGAPTTRLATLGLEYPRR